jgi:hypothetical protein
MAEEEVTNAAIDAENCRQKHDVVTKRFLFTVAAALVTIGFWGIVFAFDRASYAAVGLVFGAVGFALLAVAGEWRMRKFMRRRKARKLTASLRRVEILMRRIRAMERGLDKRHKAVSKELREELKQDYHTARKKLLKGLRGSEAEAPEEHVPHSAESFEPKKTPGNTAGPGARVVEAGVVPASPLSLPATRKFRGLRGSPCPPSSTNLSCPAATPPRGRSARRTALSSTPWG